MSVAHYQSPGGVCGAAATRGAGGGWVPVATPPASLVVLRGSSPGGARHRQQLCMWGPLPPPTNAELLVHAPPSNLLPPLRVVARERVATAGCMGGWGEEAEADERKDDEEEENEAKTDNEEEEEEGGLSACGGRAQVQAWAADRVRPGSAVMEAVSLSAREVWTPDDDGRTPLHWAGQEGDRRLWSGLQRLVISDALTPLRCAAAAATEAQRGEVSLEAVRAAMADLQKRGKDGRGAAEIRSRADLVAQALQLRWAAVAAVTPHGLALSGVASKLSEMGVAGQGWAAEEGACPAAHISWPEDDYGFTPPFLALRAAVPADNGQGGVRIPAADAAPTRFGAFWAAEARRLLRGRPTLLHAACAGGAHVAAIRALCPAAGEHWDECGHAPAHVAVLAHMGPAPLSDLGHRDTEAVTRRGQTVLMLACAFWPAEEACAAVAAGGDQYGAPAAVDAMGRQAAHYAAGSCWGDATAAAVLRALLAAGVACGDAADGRGVSAAHVAAGRGHVAALSVLAAAAPSALTATAALARAEAVAALGSGAARRAGDRWRQSTATAASRSPGREDSEERALTPVQLLWVRHGDRGVNALRQQLSKRLQRTVDEALRGGPLRPPRTPPSARPAVDLDYEYEEDEEEGDAIGGRRRDAARGRREAGLAMALARRQLPSYSSTLVAPDAQEALGREEAMAARAGTIQVRSKPFWRDLIYWRTFQYGPPFLPARRYLTPSYPPLPLGTACREAGQDHVRDSGRLAARRSLGSGRCAVRLLERPTRRVRRRRRRRAARRGCLPGRLADSGSSSSSTSSSSHNPTRAPPLCRCTLRPGRGSALRGR